MKNNKYLVTNSDNWTIQDSRTVQNPGRMPVSACAKAILVGEHSVVYGTQAVAMPLTNMRIELTGQFLGPDSSTEVIINGQDVTNDAAEIIAQAFNLVSATARPILIHGRSNVLIGAGLGSSATLCVGILRTVQGLVGHVSTIDQLEMLANKLEERFHGNPSGLDAAVVASERAIKFRRGESPTGIHVSPIYLSSTEQVPWRFAIIDSQERSSTMAMVEKASSFFHSEKRAAILAEFEHLTSLAITGLEAGKIEFVAEAMNGCNELLRKTGVVTKKLSTLIAAAREIGCSAVKPTGAGGGGCVIALLNPGSWEEQLINLRACYPANQVFEASL